MKKIQIPEIGSTINNSTENDLKQITMMLEDSHYPDNHSTRVFLDNLGKTILPRLHEILCSENGSIRLEAAKIIKFIADERSIPVMIYMLDDNEISIRWVAAEGLINIGRSSIVPLLRSIRDRKNPSFLYRGAHHVLNKLLLADEKEKLTPLLHSLDNYHQLSGISPALAFNALETVFKREKRL